MAEAVPWGRLAVQPQRLVALPSRFAPLPDEPPLLAYGNGRSYGDVCQNAGGTLLLTRSLDRLIAFDPEHGVLECEAGILLSEIIDLMMPHGWFPAVTPGTAFVTVGGAIANDVHGKNHHRAGTFAHHVLGFELQRTDGRVMKCTRSSNVEWFRATVGGLGLTGLIRTARLQLRRVPGPWIFGDSQRFGSLAEFFAISEKSDRDYEYTVAWLDCSNKRNLGRGVFMRGNHAARPQRGLREPRNTSWRVPMTPPVSAITRATVAVFNEFYFRRPSAQRTQAHWHYRTYLFPLDAIRDWNRIYGPRGFFQYQCVLPPSTAAKALADMLRTIAGSGEGSFLSVLKQFGAVPSLGMLSFPRPGATLALDFPNRGASTLSLLETLDSITLAAGGAVYPAKDARMSGAAFREYFPSWERFSHFIDPKFSSSFWRRVTASPV